MSSFFKGIKKFVIDAKTDPGHIMNIVKEHAPPEVKKDLDKQLKTFASDAEKLEKGEMSYAEMRARYG